MKKTFFNAKIFISLLFFILLCDCVLFAQQKSVAQRRQDVVNECKKYIGTPYVLGGESKSGIDCSGLIMVTARDAANVILPRRAADIYSYVRIIPDSQKQIGDLLFFKTTSSGQISHVAVYIGNGQFIHAVSDGPNTGVIVSSLNQPYWKPKYCGCGTYFEDTPSSTRKNSSNVALSSDSGANSSERFFLDLDFTAHFNWNLFTASDFSFNPHGFSIQNHATYNRGKMHPGFGIDFRDEILMGVFQIPIYFSISPKDFVRIYVGPVFTFGKAILSDGETTAKASIFPGIIGVSFQTPALKIKNVVGLRLAQDISYTVYNNNANCALNFVNAQYAGFRFQSGVRVDVYLPKFTKKAPKTDVKTEIAPKVTTEKKSETIVQPTTEIVPTDTEPTIPQSTDVTETLPSEILQPAENPQTSEGVQ